MAGSLSTGNHLHHVGWYLSGEKLKVVLAEFSTLRQTVFIHRTVNTCVQVKMAPTIAKHLSHAPLLGMLLCLLTSVWLYCKGLQRNNHSSVLRTFVNYGRKNGPQRTFRIIETGTTALAAQNTRQPRLPILRWGWESLLKGKDQFNLPLCTS